MSVGFAVTKAEVDQRAGTITRSVYAVMRDVAQFQTWLASTPDVDLEGLGYSSGEVAVLKSAFADLDHLAGVWNGGAPHDDAYTYQQFAHLLTGVTVY